MESCSHSFADGRSHVIGSLSLYISVTIYLPIFLVTTITTVYSVAALKQIMGGRKWSLWRVSSFWSGAALMLVGGSPLHRAHSHYLFYYPMTQHLLSVTFAS